MQRTTRANVRRHFRCPRLPPLPPSRRRARFSARQRRYPWTLMNSTCSRQNLTEPPRSLRTAGLSRLLPDWHPNEIDRQTALQPLRQASQCMAAFANLLAESRPLDASYRGLPCRIWRLGARRIWLCRHALRRPRICLGGSGLTHHAGLPALPRLLTLARVALEAGKRALSVQALCHFLNGGERPGCCAWRNHSGRPAPFLMD